MIRHARAPGCGCKLGVPLAQIEPIGADIATREAAADWRYWVAMGDEF